MTPRTVRFVLTGLMSLVQASTAGAQGGQPVGMRAALARATSIREEAGRTAGPSLAIPAVLRPVQTAAWTERDQYSPWWAPVASGIVPGSGQLVMGQQRGVGYLIADGYLLLQRVRSRRDANRDRDAYRTLASDVARKPFGGDRPRGSWDYYESMEKFLESGAFDRIAGGAVDPETDETTYNGARWLLARETYWVNPDVAPPLASPEYQRALAFYQSRAVPAAYRWSWRDAQLEKDVYGQTIASANRSVQRAVSYVGLIGANHLLSLIDAYVSVRVRRFGGAGVVGMHLERVSTVVESVGDPRDGNRRVMAAVRLVPAAR